MNPKKIFVGISGLMLALLLPLMSANAQILNQDLEKQYEKEKKELNANAPAQNQAPASAPASAPAAATAADDGDGIEIGGPPPRENFSTLSQQDADTIIEAAKSLETENPELAKKLLDIGK